MLIDNRNYDGILWYKNRGYWMNNKYGLQHHYVYEKLTGCKVFKWQVIHHLDGDPSNNTAENLVCMTRADHQYFHNVIQKDDVKMKRSNARLGKSQFAIKNENEMNKIRLKMSISHKGLKYHQKVLTCPYCGNIGGIANMHRYHFENCKLRNKNE